MISSCLSKNSCSLQEFNKTILEYQSGLEKSGYKKNLSYVKQELKKKKQINSTQLQSTSKYRSRKIIWFNLPFNEEVSTNIGKNFFTLNKYFSPGNKYHKVFNKNYTKFSYSCMPNLRSIINKQNTSHLNNPDNKLDAKQCNCRSAKNCPLNKKCCRSSIVYKASLKTDKQTNFIMKVVKQHLNCDIITKTNPLKTIKK